MSPVTPILCYYFFFDHFFLGLLKQIFDFENPEKPANSIGTLTLVLLGESRVHAQTLTLGVEKQC